MHNAMADELYGMEGISASAAGKARHLVNWGDVRHNESRLSLCVTVYHFVGPVRRPEIILLQGLSSSRDQWGHMAVKILEVRELSTNTDWACSTGRTCISLHLGRKLSCSCGRVPMEDCSLTLSHLTRPYLNRRPDVIQPRCTEE